MYGYRTVKQIKNSKLNRIRIFINRILRREVLKLEMEVAIKIMPPFHPICKHAIFPEDRCDK